MNSSSIPDCVDKCVNGGMYLVTNYDNAKERIVMGNPTEAKVSCTCRKFETHGILCSHALKVLDVMNIKLIPEHYLLKRWTRDARLGSNQDWNGRHVELDTKAHFMMRYNELCPRMNKLTNKASGTHETYTFLSKVCEESNKIIDDMLSKKCVDGASVGMVHVSISIQKDEIANMDTAGMPKGVKKRVSLRNNNKRAKSWLERHNKKVAQQKRKKSQENVVQLLPQQVTIQTTQPSHVDNGILHQAKSQATQSSHASNGTPHQATSQATQSSHVNLGAS